MKLLINNMNGLTLHLDEIKHGNPESTNSEDTPEPNCIGPLGKVLTHWGQVTHICAGNLTIIVSDNGLVPTMWQDIIWTNGGILLIGPLGTNFSEILKGIQTFSYMKMHLKMSSAKWRPFCLGLNVLTTLLKYLREQVCFFLPHSRGLIELFLLKFWVKQWSGRMLYTTASKHLWKIWNWPYLHSVEKLSLFL